MYTATAFLMLSALAGGSYAAPSPNSYSATGIVGLAYGEDHTTIEHEIEVISPNSAIPVVNRTSCCETRPSAPNDRVSPGMLDLVGAEPEFANDDGSDSDMWKVYARLQLNDAMGYYPGGVGSVDTVQVTVGGSTIYACNNCSSENYDWFNALFVIHNVTATQMPSSDLQLSTPYIAVQYNWNLNSNGDAYTPTVYSASCGAAKEDPNAAYIQAPGLCWTPSEKLVLPIPAPVSNYTSPNFTANGTVPEYSSDGYTAQASVVGSAIMLAAALLF